MAENNGANKEKRYALGDMLGKGAFGKVYKAIDLETGTTVAVKQIKIANGHIPDEDMNEIRLLKKLDHENIVKYMDDFTTDQQLNIVTEYLESGSLQSLYKSFGIMSEEYYSKIMFQVLQGLKALHAAGVLHRDMKAANLLCDRQGNVKITDFGVSEQLGQQTNLEAIAGSPYWIAREVLLMEACNEKSDIWSAGATLYELIKGEPPYFQLSPMSAMYHIATDPAIEGIPTVFPSAYDFISQCFTFDVEKRPGCDQLLKHEFIAKYNRVEGSSIETQDAQAEFNDFSDSEHEQKLNHHSLQTEIQKKQIKDQFKLFANGNFNISQEIETYMTEENKQVANLVFDASKQFGARTITEGLVSDLKMKDDEASVFKIRVWIKLFKFLLYVLKNVTKANQIDFLQDLLQIDFMAHFAKVADLLAASKHELRFVDVELRLPDAVVSFLQIVVARSESYVLFSSRRGFVNLLKLPIMHNYQIVAAVIQLLKQFTSPPKEQNHSKYQREFIQSILQAQGMLVSLRLLLKLTFYNCATDQFELEALGACSDFGPWPLQPHPESHRQQQVKNQHSLRVGLMDDLLELQTQFVNQNQVDMKHVLTSDNLGLFFNLLRYYAQCTAQQQRGTCQLCNDRSSTHRFCQKLLRVFQRIHQICGREQYEFDFLKYLHRLLEMVVIVPSFKQDIILNLHSLFFNRHDLLHRSLKQKEYAKLLIESNHPMITFDILKIISGISLVHMHAECLQSFVELKLIDCVLSFIHKYPTEVYTIVGKLYLLPLGKQFGAMQQIPLTREMQANKANAAAIQQLILDPAVLEKLCSVMFDPRNFDQDTFLRVSLDLLKAIPELCNAIETNDRLFATLLGSILDTNQADNLKLHFLILMEIYTASKNPRQMARKHRLFRKVSELEMNCSLPGIKVDMKQFMAGLLEMEMI